MKIAELFLYKEWEELAVKVNKEKLSPRPPGTNIKEWVGNIEDFLPSGCKYDVNKEIPETIPDALALLDTEFLNLLIKIAKEFGICLSINDYGTVYAERFDKNREYKKMWLSLFNEISSMRTKIEDVKKEADQPQAASNFDSQLYTLDCIMDAYLSIERKQSQEEVKVFVKRESKTTV